MKATAIIYRLWNTVRYLQPRQVYGRIWFRLYRPEIDLRPAPPLSDPSGIWVLPTRRRSSFDGNSVFTFLNRTHDLNDIGWDNVGISKLWRFNLHYFDDLNAQDYELKRSAHQTLIGRWITENPPAAGSGWEPYPASLRVVNWTKWILGGGPASEATRHSLAVQTRWLAKRLEYHLLGNHLFSNAKALIFSGLLFDGQEAQTWALMGTKILVEQLDEQILEDGGQFELSTMYHALALEDVLDLINILTVFRDRIPADLATLKDQLRARAKSMLQWLHAMSHPDGDISFFNDAAKAIAPSNAELFAYAKRLDIGEVAVEPKRTILLHETGYVRFEDGPVIAILDVGKVGPDYLPGHAHADSLSFELSLFGQRLVVNSGTSEYGTGPERERQRATAAHSTVEVDEESSSETWRGFRVARRANPFGLEIAEDQNGGVSITCSHDGYKRLPGSVVHTRKWTFQANAIQIADELTGKWRTSVAYFHLFPDIQDMDISGTSVSMKMPSGRLIRFNIAGARLVEICESSWHPEFGKSVPNKLVRVHFADEQLLTRVEWN